MKKSNRRPSLARLCVCGAGLLAIATTCATARAQSERVAATAQTTAILSEIELWRGRDQAASLRAALKAEELARAKPMVTQDDAMPLMTAARNYAQAGEHLKAIALWQRVRAIPAAPGARPPGLLPGPRDYRGEALWGIAESLRAEQKWEQALEVYQRLRAKWPLNDGCVDVGASLQRMAIGEGACLENLGRYDEAVRLYWSAAINLRAPISPAAMRRLIELYLATGQLPVLDAAIARESEALTCYERDLIAYGVEGALDAQQQKQLNSQLSYSFIPAYESARRMQLAARARNWNALLEPLQRASQPDETSGPDLLRIARGEAIWALASLAPAALPVLRRAADEAPANRELAAALLFCRANDLQRTWLLSNSNAKAPPRRTLLGIIAYNEPPAHFAEPPPTLQLPSLLAPIVNSK